MQSKFDFHASNGKAPEQCPSRSGQRRTKEEAVLQCFNRQGVNGITDHSSSWSWCPVSMQQPKLDGGSMIIGDNVLLKERCLHSNKCEYNNMFLLGRSRPGPIKLSPGLPPQIRYHPDRGASPLFVGSGLLSRRSIKSKAGTRTKVHQ
jgi:hypothetical protein